ncbi:hypothetical protein ABZX99_34305 [Streptomyces antibioticus]|uniref:hypothetical protein n=1 Tax=Streptomyces antibioticus TaxID=1890 RepID=UPI0033BD572D
MDEACELKVPDDRLGEIAVQQAAGAFQVANEQSDDQADHRQVLAVLEQDGDQRGQGDVCLDQLVAHLLQRLQCAHAGEGADAGPPVPEPGVLASDVGPASTSTSDIKFGAVGVEVVFLNPGAVLAVTACKGACARQCGVVEHMVQHRDGGAEVRSEQRHERTAVPGRKRGHSEP